VIVPEAERDDKINNNPAEMLDQMKAKMQNEIR
jgi:hypothetical protein